MSVRLFKYQQFVEWNTIPTNIWILDSHKYLDQVIFTLTTILRANLSLAKLA